MNNLSKFQLKVMELSESSAERERFGPSLAVDGWFSAEGISHFNLGESGRFPWH